MFVSGGMFTFECDIDMYGRVQSSCCDQHRLSYSSENKVGSENMREV